MSELKQGQGQRIENMHFSCTSILLCSRCILECSISMNSEEADAIGKGVPTVTSKH